MFKELSEVLPEKVTINLTVSKAGDQMTILVTTQDTEKKIVPMSIAGSPGEIDKNFISTIGETLKGSKELMVQMEKHKEHLKTKQAELEEKMKKKDITKKAKPVKKKDDDDEPESLFAADDKEDKESEVESE